VSRPNRTARGAAIKPPAPANPVKSPAEKTRVEKSRAKSSDVFGWAIPVYLLLLSAGFAFLRSPIATVHGNELSIDRAAFSAINAVTLTGFAQTIGLDELRVPGQIGVFILMTGGTILSLIIGGQLVAAIIGLPFSNRQISLAAGSGVGVALLFGAAGLGDTVLHGAFQGVSALGNCGLFIGKLPAADDFSTMAILLPLAVFGGLGVPIWLELGASLIKRRPISTQALASLSMYGGAYIVGLFLLLTQLASFDSFPPALATCSAAAIAARSAGFHLISIAQFTRAGQWILAGLMVFGAASGGTGGGIKGTTFVVLFRGLRNSYSGQSGGRILAIAATWIGAYAILILGGFLVLLECAPQVPGDRLLFLTISAASNVGWSHDPVSLVKSGLSTISLVMMLGRAIPMAVLWWMSRSARGAEFAVG
jgi:trk system potassium uptake protein